MRVFKRAAWRTPRAQRKLDKAFAQIWVSVGARVTFRAEVMPSRVASERTFTVARVLTSKRIELTGLAGQHAETEFESGEGTHGVP
jgi:hypothetical protein